MTGPDLLLVEDDDRLGPLLRDLLGLDWAVTWVPTLAAARAELDRRLFAVLVVDRGLPDGDGVELVRGLRAAGVATPTLLLTAYGELDDRVGGLDAGADDYLVKPFEVAELQARLRALTRDHSGRGEAVDIGS